MVSKGEFLKTLVFSIYENFSFEPNVPDVRTRPKTIFPPVSPRLFLHKYGGSLVFVEISYDDLVNISKENENENTVSTFF